ncbi:DNA internalization-related competence protein ComEC/Rec2 [uncultured Trichococcus sp.]|uniref:DNA internalization-related competence protein ComEC/Rec2 n=1 Tax=uncultured Trichococcus sp. TaxID=189665 RepID=UPI0029C6A8FF|nr:DNA internalization-related competence protein ComEC/Rec2 [uncultured Trichococcus sp.]
MPALLVFPVTIIGFDGTNVFAWVLLIAIFARLYLMQSKTLNVIAAAVVVASLTSLLVHQWSSASEFTAQEAESVRKAALQLDPNDLRINGDLLTGEALLLWGGKEEKVYFHYTIATEEEKFTWEQMRFPQRFVAAVRLEAPEAERNLHQFDFEEYLNAKGIHWAAAIEAMEFRSEDRSVWSLPSSIRRSIILMLEKLPAVQTTDYIQTMLFNQAHAISGDTLDAYRGIGLLHLFSISGMHIQLLLAQVRYILLRMKVSHETTDKLLVVFLLAYGVLTGWGIGVFRAICTHLILLVGKITGHRIDAKDAFAFTVMVAVFYNPLLIYSASFQLSYLLAGVLYFVAPISAEWEMNGLLRDICLTALMTMASFPVVAYHFFEVSWLGIFVNVIFSFFFSWLLFPLFWLLLFTVLFSPGTPLLGSLCAVSDKLLTLLEHFAGAAADLDFASLVTGRPPAVYFVLVWIALLLLLLSVEKRQRDIRVLCVLMAAVGLFSFAHQLTPSGKVVMLDVGQGDAILIITPFHRRAVLIDTGGMLTFEKEAWQVRESATTAGEKLVSTLKAEGVKKLDMVFLTHADQDHVGSLRELAEGLPIAAVYFPKGAEGNAAFAAVLLELQSRHQVGLFPVLGKVDLKLAADFVFHILAPLAPGEGGNEDSLVIQTSIGGLDWLFTGDLGEDGEGLLVRTYPDLKADILKIGHHGSATSSSEGFLDHVQPKLALISVGKQNRYGHPDAEILERLELRNIPVFRTDRQGAVHFRYGPGETEWRTILENKK